MENNKKPQEILENIIICNNARCITATEKYVPQIFYLVDGEKNEYRCQYCDHIEILKVK